MLNKNKFITIIFFLFLSIGLLLPSLNINSAMATGSPRDCSREGQCVGNNKCTEMPAGSGNWIFDGTCGSEIIGGVTPPDSIRRFNTLAILGGGMSGSIGILIFASQLIRLGTIIAGIWVMFNFILSGYQFIMGFGDTNAYKAVKERLTWSMIGIILIVAAYAGAGIIGLLFFGDAGFILNPQLYSAIETQ